jgi:hypothetical protein
MIHHYRPEFGALNCPLLCRLRGPLDVPTLIASVNGLAERHEALRTTFAGRGRTLTQLIHPHRPMPLEIDEVAERDLPAVIGAELGTRLDPAEQPVRARLWRVAHGDHVLCLTMHHLVTDAWSCGVALRDLRALYALGVGAPGPALPALRWQYSDFIRWQNDLIAGDGLTRHRTYWHRQLAGLRLPRLPEPVELPAGAGHVAPAVVTHSIPPSQVEALRALARAEHSTLFAVLLALFYRELHRVTGERDLAVASLFANRSRPEARDIVGFLANMVLLRAAVPAGGSFPDLVAQTHRAVIGAIAHQELPFQLLPVPPATGPARRADDIVFQVMTDPGHRETVGDVEFELLVPESIGSRFRFELAVAPVDGGLRLVLYHTTDRLEPGFAQRFVAAYAESARAVTPDTLTRPGP